MSAGNKILSPAEMAVGMFVTVLENKPFIREEPEGGMFGGGPVHTIATVDRSGMGEVHTVLAIELPFVVVRRESDYEHSRFTHSYDTRRTTFMELKPDYVKALIPKLALAKEATP